MRFLGRMDRHVGGAVVEAYLATGAAFVVISVLFDLLVSLGRYLRVAQEKLHIGTGALARLLGEFYVCSVPVLFLNYAPYVTVIACMFGVSKLTAANELVPMVFSGRSMFRVLRPALAVAVLSGLAMAGVWQFGGGLVERWFAVHGMLEKAKEDDAIKHVLVRSGDRGDILHCRRYLPEQQRMEGVLVYHRARNDDGGGVQVTRAKSAQWTDASASWVLDDGWRRTGDREVRVEQLELPGVLPDTVLRLGRASEPEHVQLLSYSELAQLRALRPGRHDLVLAYHLHFATPLACLILVLLTLPLAVHFERGSRVGRVIAAFFVCAAFLVFDLTCRNLGLRQFVHPVVAAWSPTIVFGALGALTYSGIRT